MDPLRRVTVRFAYVEMPELDATRKRVELETDLIGAYYLAENKTPTAQFGRDERVPFE